MPDLILRPARPDDAESLAALHVSVWRETYRDDATQKALEQLDEARRLPSWTNAIARQSDDAGVIAAVSENALVGVIGFGPSEHEAFGGRVEIKHLYVAIHAQGKGIGRALLAHVLDLGPTRGWAGIGLAVVRQNLGAQRFYQRMGGEEIGAFTDPGPLWRSENIVMAWDAPPR